MVGARGFEPPTSRSQTERTTRLCYAPKSLRRFIQETVSNAEFYKRKSLRSSQNIVKTPYLLNYFANRSFSMAYLLLYSVREFSEGFGKPVGNKNRIIAEAAFSARRKSDSTLANAFGGEFYRAVFVGDRHRADEPSAAIFRVPDFRQQFFNSLLIARVRAGVASGKNAGRAAQRFNFQTRIVRQSPNAGLQSVGTRFQSGVFGERRARFLRLETVRKIFQTY